jgi:preprotein translocase YajC subunit
MPMLISPAYAQGTSMMDQSALIQFLPLVLIFIVFYFLLIRPQQKKQKDHRTMLDALRRGDRIVTGGGILGTVSKVVASSPSPTLPRHARRRGRRIVRGPRRRKRRGARPARFDRQDLNCPTRLDPAMNNRHRGTTGKA